MSYYNQDLPNCGGVKAIGQTTCQEIWGINTGDFTDVAVQFPSKQDITDLATLKQILELTDNNNQKKSFTASITKTTVTDKFV